MTEITYKANDDLEHSTKDSGETRNRVLAAAEEATESVKRYLRSLQDEAKTADGVPISECLGKKVWVMGRNPHPISDTDLSFLCLSEIDLGAENVQIDAELYMDRRRVCVRLFHYEYDSYTHIDVGLIYASRETAIQAMIEIAEEAIVKLRSELTGAKPAA